MFVGAGSLLVSGWESKWPLATPINCISSALSKASFVLWTFKIDFSSCGMQKVCFGGKPPFLLPNYWGISNFRHLGNSKYIFIWLVTSAATGNQVFPTVSAQVCFPLGQDLTTLMLTLCCLAHFWSVRNTYASFVPTNSGDSGWPQLGHLSVDFSLVVCQLASGPLHLQEEVRHQALSLCNWGWWGWWWVLWVFCGNPFHQCEVRHFLPLTRGWGESHPTLMRLSKNASPELLKKNVLITIS